MSDRPYRLAVDIGGTFVDAMELDQRTGVVRFRKASTTPDRPWEGVLAAVEALGTAPRGRRAVHPRHDARPQRGARAPRSATGIITNAGLRTSS